MGRGDVRSGHGDTLVAHQLETALPTLVQCYAVVAHRLRSLHRDCRHLSIRLRRDATVHIFPVLI